VVDIPLGTVKYNAFSQTVMLKATVVPSVGTAIGEGTMTFIVKDILNNTVGSSVSLAPVVAGSASVNYTLPGGTAVGSYTIVAAYSGTASYEASSDSAQPPSRGLTITPGLLTGDVAGVGPDFKHVDGFDVLFAKGNSNTSLKLKNTNPGTFHYEMKLTNETGTELHQKNVTISDRNGGEVTVILTVPSLPTIPGVPVPASAGAYTDVTKGAFLTRSNHPVKAHPEEREHEEMAMDVR
jgi:hypothetical protein